MEKLIVNNYGSFDITFTKGKNATLWDSKNKKYIDFIAGIGVNSLGHQNRQKNRFTFQIIISATQGFHIQKNF